MLKSTISHVIIQMPRIVLLISRIEEAVAHLAEHPALGRAGRVPGTRELVISDTHYIIPYRVRRNAVEILRVFHSARRWPTEF